MKIVHKEQKKCEHKNGNVSFYFKDYRLTPFNVDGVKFSGICDSYFTLRQGSKVSDPFELTLNRSANCLLQVDGDTEIIIHGVPYGDTIELFLHCQYEKITAKIQPFYMIFAENKNNYNKMPTVKFETEEEAETEALRIAQKEMCEVYVFKSVKKISLIPNVETIN